MIEVRPYEGSAEDLSNFVTATWRRDYAGQMAFPLWSAEYLRWQLRLGEERFRKYQVAAYDGTRLVGTLLAAPCAFQTPEGRVAGAHGSWLAVDPEYRGQKIVGRMAEERVRRMAEDGGRLVVSYRFFGSKHSLAERPPTDKVDGGKTFIGKRGFWARVLDTPRAARWNVLGWESILTRVGGPFTPHPRVTEAKGVIRPARDEDIPRCVELMRKMTAGMSVAVAWDEELLRHQLLGSPVAQTLVTETEGTVRGFVNFHVLPFLGRTEEPVGIIDILCLEAVTSRDCNPLVNAALAAMREQGGVLALKIGCGDAPWGTLLWTHFVPRLPDSYLVFQWPQAPIGGSLSGPMHLLWR